MTSFDFNEYVFVGQITNLVGPFSTPLSTTTYGFEVAVGEAANLPTPSKSYIVFMFNHNSMCSSIPREQSAYTKLIGHHVRIAARTLELFKLEPSSVASPVLQIGSYGDEFIQEIDPNLEAQLSVPLDYKSISEWVGDHYNDPLHWYALSMADYTLRLELLRLKKLQSSKERASLVSRLAYHPQFVSYYNHRPVFAVQFISNNLNDPEKTKVLAAYDDWAVNLITKRLNMVILMGQYDPKSAVHSTAHELYLTALDSLKTSKSEASAHAYRTRRWDELDAVCNNLQGQERECCQNSVEHMRKGRFLPPPAFAPYAKNFFCSQLTDEQKSLPCSGSMKWCAPK